MAPGAKAARPAPGRGAGLGLAGRLSIAVAVLAVVLVAPEPGTVPGPLERVNLQTPNTTDIDTPLYSRSNVGFPCSGERCEAWLYLPKARAAPGKPPLVLVAHGMGGQRDTGLHKYSAYFADAGLAVFTFDYRGFGGSGGEPRHWISPRRHLEDWRAAYDYVTGTGAGGPLGGVDTDRVVLWGTSFAGGHALVLASQLRDPRVRAVVAQVPHLNATAATLQSVARRGIPKSLRLLALGLKDLARAALGLPPLYVPLTGPPGSLAIMQLGAKDMRHYLGARPATPQGGWRNMALARLTAEMFFQKYSPIKHVPRVEVPVLFVASTQDDLCPFEQVEAGLKAARRGTLVKRDVTHFQLTGPAHLPSLMGEQVAWVLEALGEAGGGGADAHAAAEGAAAEATEASASDAAGGEAAAE